jgi:ubiquinone/menaquinone biosynthesis C-methylase UbiE
MKKILDATCGSRMMWFDKEHPDTVYVDKRTESITACDGRIINVRPDIVADFTKLPFPDNSFYLVVFDPPHVDNLGEKSWMAQKYGKLFPGWEDQIKEGFNECMRVLKTNGTLIFKWSEIRIPVSKVVDVIGVQPLFGHPTGKAGKTIWMTFFKQ